MKQLLLLLVLSAFLASCGGKAETVGKADSSGSASGTKGSAGGDTGKTSAGGSTTTGGTTSPGRGLYTAESGIIEMKAIGLEGMTVTTYFKDHGATKATHSMIDMMGTKTGQVMIEEGGFLTTFNTTSKTGTRSRIPAGTSDSPEEMTGAMPDMSRYSSMTDEQKTQYKYTELDNRTVAGKEGKGFSVDVSGIKLKAWLWENIPLRMEMDMGGREPMIIEATKVETDVPVPDDKFVVPADVKITETDTPKP